VIVSIAATVTNIIANAAASTSYDAAIMNVGLVSIANLSLNGILSLHHSFTNDVAAKCIVPLCQPAVVRGLMQHLKHSSEIDIECIMTILINICM